MSSSITRARLHHRPFAVLGQRLDHTPPPPPLADTVRAEVRALVSRGALARRDGDDVLARLGLHTLPHRWAVGATVPVTVEVRAPNDRYAARVGTAQLITVLGRLRTGYLADPDHLTGPTTHPAARSLQRLLVRRTDPCPGYPVGGIYTVTAEALLAITVTADDPATAWTTARNQLTRDLDLLSGINHATHLLRRTGLRRLGDLDHAIDNAA